MRNFDAFAEILDGIEQKPPGNASTAANVAPRNPEVQK